MANKIKTNKIHQKLFHQPKAKNLSRLQQIYQNIYVGIQYCYNCKW